MRNRSFALAATLLLLVAASPLHACLWDYDTLRDEQRGLPGIAEILSGRWEKHSQYFYQQRISNMHALIAKEPGNWAAYDNLAVAYEKVGNPSEAIAVMLRKETAHPGEYTTYANLGTFYLHTGELDRGIGFIEKALQINPAAHFGREEYQLKYAIYLRDAKKDPTVRGTLNFLLYKPGEKADTRPATHARVWKGSPTLARELGIKDNAIEGIVGIIRFGTGTSPDLYYALGDLLALRDDKALAIRAYKRAIEFGHGESEAVAEQITSLSEFLESNAEISDPLIAKEQADAKAWVEKYQAFEDELVKNGTDVDAQAAYDPFYKKNGPAVTPIPASLSDMLPKDRATRTILFSGVFLFVALVVSCWAVAWVAKVIRQRRSLSQK